MEQDELPGTDRDEEGDDSGKDPIAGLPDSWEVCCLLSLQVLNLSQN